MCYGRDLARGTMVNEGEAVGIIAAQSIGEPGTQLTMRTFHIGGVAQGGQQSFLEASQEGKIEFRNANLLENAMGELIVMGRNMQLAIIDETGQERASHKLGYGTKVHVKEGAKVKRGDKLFEWDPYTLPIIAEKAGVAKFVDLIAGHRGPRGDRRCHRHDPEDRHRLALGAARQRSEARDHHHGQGNRRAGPQRRRQPDHLCHVGGRDPVGRGRPGHQGRRRGGADPARRRQDQGHHRRSAAGGGTVRGAASRRTMRSSPRSTAMSASAATTRTSGGSPSSRPTTPLQPVEYMVPKGKHIPVQEGDFVQKGDYIMDGNPAPHDILRIMGIEALADYLIDEVQDVYRLQGVKINDKHIEVIVRQMLQKIEILDSGDTTLLKGENCRQGRVRRGERQGRGPRRASGDRRAGAAGHHQGSLQTRSFISAASFQETTRVLTEASVQGKRDKLVGLKENVIVGRLIPAGTGGAPRKVPQDRRRPRPEGDRGGPGRGGSRGAGWRRRSKDVVGGDEFDSMLVETPESRD